MLLFMDSFDHVMAADMTKKWTSVAPPGGSVNDTSAVVSTGRHGSNSWKMSVTGAATNAASSRLFLTVAPADNTLILGVAFNPVSSLSQLATGVNPESTGGGAASTLLMVRQAGNPQCWVRVDPAGTLTLLRGTTVSTVVGTTTLALTQGTYNFVEIRLTIHASTGACSIRINGNPALSLTNINTAFTGTNTWTDVRLGHTAGGNGQNQEWQFDDLYLLDGSGLAPWNDFLGDCRVDVRAATAPGALTQWTPSAGANWQCVDDATPNDDTDYTTSSTPGQSDSFVVQDAPVAGTTIYGVQQSLYARKLDAGACELAALVRHSGTNYTVATPQPTTAYNYLRAVMATNPGTSVAWTEAGFNAAEFGYQRTV